MTRIEVYSDGSGQTSGTDGGYGWVIVIDGQKHSEGSGHVKNATNNDMELESAIQGLKAALQLVRGWDNAHIDDIYPWSGEVTLVSDSQIILGWANKSYRFKQESKVEKYRELREVYDRLNAKTRWVKGHSGDFYNEMCDKLANNARLQITEKDVDKSKPFLDTRIGTKKTGVICLYYAGQLKVIDFDAGIIENYDRDAHGKRGSFIEIREEKTR